MSQRDLFVRQLAYRTTVEGLRSAFQPYGELLEVKIPLENGKSKGYGFVVYANESSAATAIQALNGTMLDGSKIMVAVSEKRGVASSFRGGAVEQPRFSESDNGHYRDRQPSGAGDFRARVSSQQPSSRARSPPQARRSGRSPPAARSTQTHVSSFPSHSSQGSATQGLPPSAPTAPYSRSAPPQRSQGRFNEDPNESKIYISGLPPDTTEEMLVEHFGIFGAIARKRQKNMFKDQWPFNVKLYYDDNGAFKGDALVAYEDPNAALKAPEFFDGGDFFGSKISVQIARKT